MNLKRIVRIIALLSCFCGGCSISYLHSQTYNQQVASPNDDADQDGAGGTMSLAFDEFDLALDDWQGIRFLNVTIPSGAIITSAYVEFVSANGTAQTGTPADVIIYAQNSNNPATFSSTNFDISNRSRTTSNVTWNLSAWTVGASYQSPDIKTILQEVINNQGGLSSAPLAIIFQLGPNNTNRRRPATYENVDFGAAGSSAPRLVINWIMSPGGVAGAAIWLKANQGVTTGATFTWSDQSGNNRNGVQSTAGNQPTLHTSYFNFNPSISFDGTNDYLNLQNLTGLPIGAAQVEAFTVANHLNTPASWAHTFSYGSGTTNQMFAIGKQVNTDNAGTLTWTDDAISSSGEFNLGKAALLNGKYTGTQIVISSYGVQRATLNSVSNKTIANGYIGVDAALSSNTHWNGHIPEIILYGSNLTTIEAQRVNSYLAIKYGITLDQAVAYHYLASDGTTIFWNGTTNSSHNSNIAGIARDDNSALTQKQSKSVNTGLQVIIGNGNTIAASNAANASTYSADRSALVWGDNAASVTSWTTTGAPSSRQILARTWKVQETGTVGFVKIIIADNSGTNGLPAEATAVYLLTDADGNFSAGATSTTMTLNGTNWEANVDLTNGQFFTFATQIPIAPGGVYVDNSLWLKADAGTSTTTDGATVTTWSDQSIYGYHATNTSNTGSNWTNPGANPPAYQAGSNTNAVNFNPTVNFAASKSLDGVGGMATHQVFTVHKNVTATTAVLGFDDPAGNGAGGQGTLWQDPSYIILGVRNTSDNNNIQVNKTYTFGSPSSIAILDAQHISNSTGSFWINGDGGSSTVTPIGTAPSPFSTPAKYRLGKASNNTSASSPVMAEVISYGRNLSTTERQRVTSYLGVKYGITIGHNYLDADGNIVWDRTTNAGYNNNIAGMARDDESGLYHKQSRSVNSGLQLVIGNGNTIANSNSANSSTFTSDKSAMIWGNNANSVATWTTTGAPASRKKIARNWRIQETGTVGSVKIQIADNSGTNGLPVEETTVYLLLDADGNFAAGATEITMTLNGTNWEANVDLTNGQYFSFATEGCEAKAPVLTKR